MGSVNCYLIDTGAGFVLIDTGGVNNRQALLGALEAAGCRPGLLKLILLTHGDFDHSGNAASLRQAFGARIAMHAGDAGMVEGGDMFAGRKPPNPLIRLLLPAFSRFGKAERFTPDVLLAEGDDLAAYGLAARILAIPGHSKGSIALLTAEGDLFCGDLLVNLQAPGLNSLIDDAAQAQASLRRLSGLEVRLVYPGHGGPFPLDQVQPGRS
jgi:glyoxylase-like metal-dependent hydrolase (beta-lactamase superfamily II)